MKLLNKNIWTLFFIVLTFATFLLVVLSISQYKDIKKDYIIQNENFTKLVSSSTQNYFEQLDVILELLGKQLLENDNYKNVDKSKEFFKKVLKLNNSIIAYAFISPKGDFLLTQLDTAVENIPNILTIKAARESFLETLKSSKMTLGRTYFLNKTQKMAIPLRKAIFDKNGKAVGVVSIAIAVRNSPLFNEDILNSYSHVIQLLRQSDRYRQVYIYKTDDEKIDDVYKKQLDQSTYNDIMNLVESKYNKSLSELRNNESVVSFTYENKNNNLTYIASSKYIKKYDLWATSYMQYNEVLNKFYKIFFIYFAVYIITIIIIWQLFTYIYKSEEKQKKALKYKVSHDSLTDLPNRYFLDNHLNKKWIKDKEKFNLIYIDLDNFKYINDTFGHSVGDEVIVNLSKNIASILSEDDILIRLGGDEFVILSQTINIELYCKNIIKTINKSFSTGTKEVKVNGSIGVSNYPNDSKNINDLLVFADIACNNAKKIKNTFIIFDEKIKNTHYENIQIEKELKNALEDNEIYLVYQPQVHYDKSIHGVETLVRWKNKNLGYIGPDKFIEIAEKSGFMPTLGDYILDNALRQTKQLQDKISKTFQVSINISVSQFMEKDFLEKLMDKIRLYEIDPHNITLEITESIFIESVDYLVYTFTMLRAKGFTISLDDFGTGYSSLSILRRLPVNELKIDKAFVDDITFDESSKHMIKTILTIGKTLNYEIVLAEGVETQKQVDLLNEYGCDIFQGYFYSKPLSIENLEKFITDN